MRTLHITNGDGAAGIIKASKVPGDVLPWRDPMHHGPFPAGKSLEQLRAIRAAHLSGFGIDPLEIERDFELRDAHLQAATEYGRVILWFEHDLLDQLQILQILDWFGDVELGSTELQLICINKFPGLPQFRGIGQLTPDQMASLLDQAVPVTQEMTTLAQTGWRAFRSDDPREVLSFASGNLRHLPFMQTALMRHLEEFPSVLNGLTRTEHQILSLAEEGALTPAKFFLGNMELETALYIGDWATFVILDRLALAGLLCGTDGPYVAADLEKRDLFNRQELALTDKGKKALAGIDPLIDRDDWLGGVHILSGHPHWRWDPKVAAPVLCA